MSLPMSVTIKDIAREAGVSYASVSRALSGSRGVSVKTAQRILAVAKKLNYLPNGIARNLVNQRSKTLGLILPDISNPFFSDIALAVIHTAERAGYQTIPLTRIGSRARRSASSSSCESSGWMGSS